MSAIAIVAEAVAVAGTVYSAVGQQRAATYQAQVEQNNAKAAGFAADAAQLQGKIQQQQLQEHTAQVQAEQQAALAANDVSLGGGTATDIAESTAGMGERDVMLNQYNTALNVWGFRNQALAFTAQAGQSRSQATAALVAGGFNAVGSALSTAKGFNQQTNAFSGASKTYVNSAVSGGFGLNSNYNVSGLE